MLFKVYDEEDNEIVYNVLYSNEVAFTSIKEVPDLVNNFAKENGCEITQPILLDLEVSIILDTNTHFKIEYSLYDEEDGQILTMHLIEKA